MKLIIIFVFFFCNYVFSQEFNLERGDVTYTVKHLVKTVKGQSTNLKGKILCDKRECDFLIAVPVKSFVSSDSNRDLNMLTVLEAEKFPIITVRGKLKEDEIKKSESVLDVKINFHGVDKDYKIKIFSSEDNFSGNLDLDLEAHKVERPSLLTVKIDNKVKIDFNVFWKRK